MMMMMIMIMIMIIMMKIIIIIDAFEMILCGAAAVQVGTCHWTEGPKCFNRINNELTEIMKRKGYNSIDEFKGKLKEWSKEGVAKSREAKKKSGGGAGGKVNLKAGQGQQGPDGYKFLAGLMVLLVAILLADKLGHINL